MALLGDIRVLIAVMLSRQSTESRFISPLTTTNPSHWEHVAPSDPRTVKARKQGQIPRFQSVRR